MQYLTMFEDNFDHVTMTSASTDESQLGSGNMYRLLCVSLGINLATLLHIFFTVVTGLPAFAACHKRRVGDCKDKRLTLEQKKKKLRWTLLPEK